MLDQQEQMLSKTIIEMEQAVSALERACDLAKDWDWKTDPHPFGSAGNDQGLYRGHFFNSKPVVTCEQPRFIRGLQAPARQRDAQGLAFAHG
jgi:hypothetical protein